MNLPDGCHARVLNSLESSAFARMTHPQHQAVLIAGSDLSVAVGAYAGEQPIALALAIIDPAAQVAELLSLFCQASHRKRGLGTALLTLLEDELKERGCRSVSCAWSSGVTGAAAVERIFQKRGWSPPRPRMLLCTADKGIMEAPFFHPPIYHRIQRTLANAKIFPWIEVTEADRASILHRQNESPWIPSDLLPWLHEENLEPLTSVGIRIDGEVMGWLITNRLSALAVRYTCSFIRRDYALRGGIVMLYREAIWRQHERLPSGTYGIWTVPLKHHEMAEFVQRRMAPYLKSFAVTQGSTKQLTER
jgi:GNAT superfamily N-acetyltransferase